MNLGRRRGASKDHIQRLYLSEVEYTDGKISLTFGMTGYEDYVSYERLKEIHDLIGETLKHKEDYEALNRWLRGELPF